MPDMFTCDAEIDRIGLALLDRTLPKREWTHAAHFAAALFLLRRPGFDAPRAMPGLIRAYNEATGVASTDTAGYHETITQASLRAASAFLAASPKDEPLYRTANRLMASPLGDKGWLLAYWSRTALFSVPARRFWVEPDLRSLPF